MSACVGGSKCLLGIFEQQSQRTSLKELDNQLPGCQDSRLGSTSLLLLFYHGLQVLKALRRRPARHCLLLAIMR